MGKKIRLIAVRVTETEIGQLEYLALVSGKSKSDIVIDGIHKAYEAIVPQGTLPAA